MEHQLIESTRTEAMSDREQPKYEIVEYKGKPARRYFSDPEGLLRNENGQVLKRHSQSAPIIDADLQRAYQPARSQAYRDKAEAGMKAAAEGLSPNQVTAPTDAWGFIIERQSELAMSPESGHASTQAAKLVGRSVGALQERTAQVPMVNVQVNIVSDLADSEWQEDE